MKTHTIPDRWLQGALRSGLTLQEAVQRWVEQEQLEQAWQKRAGIQDS